MPVKSGWTSSRVQRCRKMKFSALKVNKKLPVSRRGIRLQAYSWPGNTRQSSFLCLSYSKHVSLNLNFLANYAQLYTLRWNFKKFMWGGRNSPSLQPHFQIYKLIWSRNTKKRRVTGCPSEGCLQRTTTLQCLFELLGLLLFHTEKNQRSFYQTVQPFLRTITPVGSERFRIFLVKFH